MTSSYPQFNPFPYQGAVSIEGTQLESTAETVRSEQFGSQPTLMIDQVSQIKGKVSQYLSRYAVGKQALGQMVVLSGDHGSGKTHAIRYVMRLVANGEIPEESSNSVAGLHSNSDSPRPAPEAPLQLYAKAEGPDFLSLYQQLMTNVPLAVLRELSLRFFAVLAGEQIGADRKDLET